MMNEKRKCVVDINKHFAPAPGGDSLNCDGACARLSLITFSVPRLEPLSSAARPGGLGAGPHEKRDGHEKMHELLAGVVSHTTHYSLQESTVHRRGSSSRPSLPSSYLRSIHPPASFPLTISGLRQEGFASAPSTST
jgi:hypothetical protein